MKSEKTWFRFRNKTISMLGNKNHSALFSEQKKGLSLIEMILVLALIGILASITAPSVLQFQEQQAISNATDLVQQTLREAFSKARSTNEIITLKAEAGSNELQRNNSAEKLPGRVVFLDDFSLTFTPPFGDLRIPATEQFRIGNGTTIVFQIAPESGLIFAEREFPSTEK